VLAIELVDLSGGPLVDKLAIESVGLWWTTCRVDVSAGQRVDLFVVWSVEMSADSWRV
jgi:hypothetical protein